MSSFVTSDNRPPTDERMDRRREEPNRGMRFPRGGRGRGGSPYWGGAKTKEADDRQVFVSSKLPYHLIICSHDCIICSRYCIICSYYCITVEPLLYDHPQNHIGVVV